MTSSDWYHLNQEDSNASTITSKIDCIDVGNIRAELQVRESCICGRKFTTGGYLYQKLKEKPASHDEKYVSLNASARSVSLFITFFSVLLATVSGGILVYVIERSGEDIIPRDECFVTAYRDSEKYHWSSNFTLKQVEECIKNRSKINNPAAGFMYVWSLYTTVGYGNTYPHTSLGRLFTIFFILIWVPQFMTFKVEFGRLSTKMVIRCGKYFQKGWFYIRNRRYDETKRPLDGVLALTLVFFIVIYFIVVTLTLGVLENLDLGTAFYVLFITVFLIGLGDIVPSTSIFTFLLLKPLFLLGDALTSYLNYYLHARTRVLLIKWAIWVASLTSRVSQVSTASSTEDLPDECEFPTVTTTSMPMNLLNTENEDDDDLALSLSQAPSLISCTTQTSNPRRK